MQKIVESFIEDNFVSISGISSKWDNRINIKDNREMSMQIALRFNPTDNKLSLTASTPIITTEY